MEEKESLFTALHHTHCSACQREEPAKPLPGWPAGGRFIVQMRVKLCWGCVKEIARKLETLGVSSDQP